MKHATNNPDRHFQSAEWQSLHNAAFLKHLIIGRPKNCLHVWLTSRAFIAFGTYIVKIGLKLRIILVVGLTAYDSQLLLHM